MKLSQGVGVTVYRTGGCTGECVGVLGERELVSGEERRIFHRLVSVGVVLVVEVEGWGEELTQCLIRSVKLSFSWTG